MLYNGLQCQRSWERTPSIPWWEVSSPSGHTKPRACWKPLWELIFSGGSERVHNSGQHLMSPYLWATERRRVVGTESERPRGCCRQRVLVEILIHDALYSPGYLWAAGWLAWVCWAALSRPWADILSGVLKCEEWFSATAEGNRLTFLIYALLIGL